MIGQIFEWSAALFMLGAGIFFVGGAIYTVIGLFMSGWGTNTSSTSHHIPSNIDSSNQHSKSTEELMKMNEILTKNRNDSLTKPDHYGGYGENS